MPTRFCAQCGAQVGPHARFCSECGVAVGGAGRERPRGWQPTVVGTTVLALFLGSGLTIWTLILAPRSPRPGPGAGPASASRPAGPPPDAASAALPEGHPRIDLPDEVRKFIVDLDAKAKQQPKDVQTWLRLAQVNARAAQLDPTYADAALAAFGHVVELEPSNADALQGIANLHYDRNEATEAVRYYERYLALRP